jgi:flagellar biosynthesis component FlhA
MENAGVIVGIAAGLAGLITGVFGAVFSVCQYLYQKRKDKEQSEREAARDKEQAERETARDKAQAERDKAQAEKQDLKDRLFFLAQLIVDRDISRESRQIFFDEYIAKGGNGSFVKWWLEGK